MAIDLDLTADLKEAALLATSPGSTDRLLADALDALWPVIPYDLATVMLLAGDTLTVRMARGLLADERVRRHHLDLHRFPSLRAAIERGQARLFTEHDHAEGDGDPFDGVLDLPHGHACMVVPLVAEGRRMGLITFDQQVCRPYGEGELGLAQVYGRLLAHAMRYEHQSELLQRMHDQWAEHNRLLAESVAGGADAGRLLRRSVSAAMARVVELARQVAPTEAPVLISGETGSGKEVVANAIHGWSRRAGHSMVSVNCAALPPTLIESELFGHVKGAFSGATGRRMGRFQAANGTTLFLDEVGELPLGLQAKLLRVVQDSTFEPVGSDRTVRVDVRLVAATHVDLARAVAEGRFRDDLYYRLHVFPIVVPPLRERVDDIPQIVGDVLASLARRTGAGPWSVSAGEMARLQRYPWPGNVRELVNALERATILARGPALHVAVAEEELVPEPVVADAPLATLEAVERGHIQRVVLACAGRIHGTGGAAEILGLNPSTLRSRMKKLGLDPASLRRARG